MVCKNCGADLKPGVKYCLNCGNYIDEEGIEEGIEEQTLDSNEQKGEDDVLNYLDAYGQGQEEKVNTISIVEDETKSNNNGNKEMFEEFNVNKNNHKKRKMTTMDMLVYGVLMLIMIVSIIVIIMTVINGNNKNNSSPSSTSTPVSDITIDMKDYKIIIPGNLSYSQENDVIYISDDKKYTFSYRNVEEDYSKYASDLTLLENGLSKSGYTVVSSETRVVNNTEFLIYKFKSGSSFNYLYMTQVNDKYSTMGTIELMNNTDWKTVLPVINNINKKIKFSNEESSNGEVSDVIQNAASSIREIIF